MKILGEIVFDAVIFFLAAFIASGACSMNKVGTCGNSDKQTTHASKPAC